VLSRLEEEENEAKTTEASKKREKRNWGNFTLPSRVNLHKKRTAPVRLRQRSLASKGKHHKCTARQRNGVDSGERLYLEETEIAANTANQDGTDWDSMTNSKRNEGGSTIRR